MPKKTEAKMYLARETFVTEIDGVPVAVHAGVTRVRDGHPLLKGRESMFDVLTAHYEVEQTTNAPGEKRG